jgi:hypothetical protein
MEEERTRYILTRLGYVTSSNTIKQEGLRHVEWIKRIYFLHVLLPFYLTKQYHVLDQSGTPQSHYSFEEITTRLSSTLACDDQAPIRMITCSISALMTAIILKRFKNKQRQEQRAIIVPVG